MLKIMASDSGLAYILMTNQLWVSSDSWQTWTPLLILAQSRLTDVLFASPGGETLIIAAEHGIYQTSNRGATWNETQFENRLLDGSPSRSMTVPVQASALSAPLIDSISEATRPSDETIDFYG